MVKYTCECGYSTSQRSDMKNHLNKRKSCTVGKDMKLANIDDFVTEGKVREKPLSIQEKNERIHKSHIKTITANNLVGKWELEKLSKYILSNMIKSSKRREHIIPSWTYKDIIKILQENSIYTVHNTILGSLEFPMMFTNGYHNTVSFDRIDDDKGYYIENIEIRPYFLNNRYKLSTQDIKDLILFREIPRNLDEINDINKIIYNSIFSRSEGDYFYSLARHIKKMCDESNRKNFEFNSTEEFMCWLIEKYIEQGLRCAYSNIPIYPQTNHKYKLSPERIDPTKHYSKDNVVLIAIELNGAPCGQFLNPHITEEQRKIAVRLGTFNQEYWNICTKLSGDTLEKCNKIRENDKRLILEKLDENIINRIYNFKPTCFDNVIEEEVRKDGTIAYKVKLSFVGKTIHFGTHETKDIAKSMLEKVYAERLIFDKLIKENENLNRKDLINSIKIKLLGEKINTKNPDIPTGIVATVNKSGKITYNVSLKFARSHVCFGIYKTLDAAKEIVEKAKIERYNFKELIKQNNDLDKIELIKEMRRRVLKLEQENEEDETEE